MDENEVCGFPLSGDSTGPSAHYCHMFKKNCSKHPSWERLKRAEIDLETLRTVRYVMYQSTGEERRSSLFNNQLEISVCLLVAKLCSTMTFEGFPKYFQILSLGFGS